MRTLLPGIAMVLLMLSGLGARALTAQSSGATLPPDPTVGQWRLNLEKSKYETPAPKSMTVTIVPTTRGYAFTIEAIGADGQAQKWGYTSAFDGAVTPVTGAAGIDSVVASSSGAGTTVIYKRAGNVITTTTSVLSDDGRTLVVTAKIPGGPGKEFTNVSVYERQ